MCGQRMRGLTLWTVVGTVRIWVGDLFGILLDGAGEGVYNAERIVMQSVPSQPASVTSGITQNRPVGVT